MPIEKVSDVAEIIEGRYYLVPCVKALRKVSGYKKGEWIPVIGDLHEDADLGVPVLHYHYDRRFISERRAIAIPETSIINLPLVTREIEYRRRKCVKAVIVAAKIVSLGQVRLYPKYKRSVLGEDRRCPHRAANLKGCKPVDGILHCPLHGLAFDAKTGAVVDANIEKVPEAARLNENIRQIYRLLAPVPTVVEIGEWADFDFPVPFGSLVMNAPVPIDGNFQYWAELRHGSWYATIDPNHPWATEWVQQNVSKGAFPVLVISQEEAAEKSLKALSKGEGSLLESIRANNPEDVSTLLSLKIKILDRSPYRTFSDELRLH